MIATPVIFRRVVGGTILGALSLALFATLPSHALAALMAPGASLVAAGETDPAVGAWWLDQRDRYLLQPPIIPELSIRLSSRMIRRTRSASANNGTVDAADYVVWRKTLSQTGSALAADGNGNGTIDNGDFSVWRSHFGQFAGSGSGANASSAVPEPTTLVLLMFAVASCRLRRRRAANKSE